MSRYTLYVVPDEFRSIKRLPGKVRQRITWRFENVHLTTMGTWHNCWADKRERPDALPRRGSRRSHVRSLECWRNGNRSP
jgi:hypothetical protein